MEGGQYNAGTPDALAPILNDALDAEPAEIYAHGWTVAFLHAWCQDIASIEKERKE